MLFVMYVIVMYEVSTSILMSHRMCMMSVMCPIVDWVMMDVSATMMIDVRCVCVVSCCDDDCVMYVMCDDVLLVMMCVMCQIVMTYVCVVIDVVEGVCDVVVCGQLVVTHVCVCVMCNTVCSDLVDVRHIVCDLLVNMCVAEGVHATAVQH